LARRPTIDSTRAEFEAQAALLRSLSGVALEGAGEGSVFVGAGDSYAAALSASFMSPRRVRAFDPYSLSRSPDWARGSTVYIISVSGATRSNVRLAAALRNVAGRVVAVTCDPSSPLAEESGEVVEIPFTPVPKSPGIAAFTLSLLVALRLSCGEVRCDFSRAASSGRRLAKDVLTSEGGVTHLVGNNEAYAASVYGAAKVYELLGGRSQASLLEEFSHTALFSLSSSDRVDVIGHSREVLARRLHKALKENGFGCAFIGASGPRAERLFALVFSLQLAAIEVAAKRGLRSPYFLSARKKLRISDRMIY